MAEAINERFSHELPEISMGDAFRKMTESKSQVEADAPDEPQEPGVQSEDARSPDTEEVSQEENSDGESPSAEDGTNEGDGNNLSDPPVSWSSDDKEIWDSLSPDVQERFRTRERERDLEIERRLNEVAKERKEIEKRAKAAEEVRKAYEEKLPEVEKHANAQLESAAAAINAQFPEIKTWEDVRKMASEDPMRYNEWQLMRTQYQALEQHHAAAKTEAEAAANRQREASDSEKREFVKAETDTFLLKAPEFKDATKSAELNKAMNDTLIDIGFTDAEITNALETAGSIPVYDHRFRLLIRDAMRYRTAQNKLKTSNGKNPPQVQRPGVARDGKGQFTANIKSLDEKLSKTGSRADAFALMMARKAKK